MSRETAMNKELWLEVGNIKITGAEIEVQLRADRDPDRPQWWKAPGDNSKFKAIAEALEKKRPVLAQLVADTESFSPPDSKLKVAAITIQYADTADRR